MAEAALTRLDEIQAEHWVSADTVARRRDLYEYRRRRFAVRPPARTYANPFTISEND